MSVCELTALSSTIYFPTIHPVSKRNVEDPKNMSRYAMHGTNIFHKHVYSRRLLTSKNLWVFVGYINRWYSMLTTRMNVYVLTCDFLLHLLYSVCLCGETEYTVYTHKPHAFIAFGKSFFVLSSSLTNDTTNLILTFTFFW